MVTPRSARICAHPSLLFSNEKSIGSQLKAGLIRAPYLCRSSSYHPLTAMIPTRWIWASLHCRASSLGRLADSLFSFLKRGAILLQPWMWRSYGYPSGPMARPRGSVLATSFPQTLHSLGWSSYQGADMLPICRSSLPSTHRLRRVAMSWSNLGCPRMTDLFFEAVILVL